MNSKHVGKKGRSTGDLAPAVKWRGRWVEWFTDDTWRFHTCLRCEGELEGDNQDGYGPECRRRRPLDWRTARRKALKEDRAAYRADKAALW